MTRLIDADELRATIISKKNDMVDLWDFAFVLNAINKSPTITPDMAQVLAYESGKSSERKKGEWKVIGFKSFWHVFCPKCNCDMFTEFTSYCPNCGEPKKEINIAELDMRGDEE